MSIDNVNNESNGSGIDLVNSLVTRLTPSKTSDPSRVARRPPSRGAADGRVGSATRDRPAPGPHVGPGRLRPRAAVERQECAAPPASGSHANAGAATPRPAGSGARSAVGLREPRPPAQRRVHGHHGVHPPGARAAVPHRTPRPMTPGAPAPPRGPHGPSARRRADAPVGGAPHRGGRKRRRRSELATTDTEENAIAAPAMMGFKRPSAAIGIPIRL